MVAIKNHEVENQICRLDGKIRVFLLYGPDGGLITERAEKLSTATGVDQSDPFSTIRIDAEHVAEDRSRLLDEAFTVGMFGGDVLLFDGIGREIVEFATTIFVVIDQFPVVLGHDGGGLASLIAVMRVMPEKRPVGDLVAFENRE